MLVMVCRHNCTFPYCEPVCPTGAIIVRTNTVYVECDDCIGCGNCRYVCRAFGTLKGLEKRPLDWLMGKA